jgi:molybdate transport system ATP-binding protein
MTAHAPSLGEAGGLRIDGGVVRGAAQVTLNLAVAPGETLALVGPNGAGKSTTLDLVAGLLALDRGTVEIAGLLVDSAIEGVFVPPERRGVGMVFQHYNLFQHLSVFDNVAFGLQVRGRSTGEVEEVATRWIDRLQLGPLVDRRPSELSGGQAQRVAIARALAVDPEVLLLDEPMAALDLEAKAELRELLADVLGRHGGPAVVVTHDPADAELLADRVGVLEGGRLRQLGTVADLRAEPVDSYVASFFP